MRVLVIGASGGVGALLQQGRERGHEFTALVRDPARLAAPVQVRTVPGDARDGSALEKALEGQDAVVFTAGVASFGPTTFFSDATRALLPAMSSQGVRRLVCITGVGAGETRGHGGFVYDRIIFPLFTRNRYRDKEVQEELIRKSGLEWTIVRPARFLDGPASAPFEALPRVGGKVLRRISREEVAAFVLKELDTAEFLRQSPFIGHAR